MTLMLFSMGAWIELSLMSSTLVLTLIWSVEVGVLASIALSLILVVKKSSRTRMSILVSLVYSSFLKSINTVCDMSKGRMPNSDRFKPINENPEAVEPLPGVLIVRVRESLDFGELRDQILSFHLY